MKHLLHIQICFVIFVILSLPARADLSLPSVFSDHMVLQRDQAVKVWGWADAGEKIRLDLGSKTFKSKADKNGQWAITLPAQKASGPLQITLTGKNSITLSDIYFGDVWLAGGQSNMEWKLSWKINQSDEEIASANFPMIRFFDVPNTVSPHSKTDIENAKWLVASPATASEFSAIAWLFAKQNHLEKNVAVGIIDSNWGGTPAEAWVSKERLLGLKNYQKEVQELYLEGKNWKEIFAHNAKNEQEKYARLRGKNYAENAAGYLFKLDTSSWQRVSLPNSEAFQDLAWLRREFTLESDQFTEATLELGDLVQEAFIWVNEQLIAEESWQTHGSTHRLPKGLLKKGHNLITIRVGNSWDNRPWAGKPDQVYLQLDDKKMDLSQNWLYSHTLEAPLAEVIRYEWAPTFLYNAMIAPLAGYSMRGVIWYQGESNVAKAEHYGELFSNLIQDWRQQWQDDFTFLFVQLAGYQAHQHPQADSQWALLRDKQDKTLALPNTGMATAIDIGQEDDIHPRNKQDVAKRLWLEAKRIEFNENIISYGPRYRSHKVLGNEVLLSFDSIGDGLKLSSAGVDAGTEVGGFIVAGSDGVFYPATATLKGNEVRVSSTKVSEPKALKYGWADFPLLNLTNSEALPALPFQILNL